MERIKYRGKAFFYKLANAKLLSLFCVILLAFAIPPAVVFTHQRQHVQQYTQMGKNFYSLPNGTPTVTSLPTVNKVPCGMVRILGVPVVADPPQAESCF